MGDATATAQIDVQWCAVCESMIDLNSRAARHHHHGAWAKLRAAWRARQAAAR